MATDTEVTPATRTGFSLRCIHCGEDNVHLDLQDLDTIRCGACENDFTVGDVRKLFAEWGRFLRWLDNVPVQ